MNPKVKDFFDGYERANAEFDVARIASCYADVFMFGNPQGVQTVKKEDFVKMLPRRKEFMRSLGLVSSKIEQMDASELGASCVLVNTVWKMRIERTGKDVAESKNSTTYILRDSGSSVEIIFQLDHQDLAKRVQEL